MRWLTTVLTALLVVSCSKKKVAPKAQEPEPATERIVLLSAYENPVMAALLKAYMKLRPGIEIDTLRLRPGRLNKRLSKSREVDVILGAPQIDLERASAAGLLAKGIPRACGDIDRKQRGARADWVGLTISAVTIGVNEDLLRRRQLPAPLSWDALTHKRYRGWIVAGRPTVSRSGRLLLTSLASVRPRIWRYWKRLDRNLFQYVAAPGAPSRLLARSRMMIALDSDRYLLAEKRAGHPIGLYYPRPTPYELEGMALARTTPHRVVARRFMSWLCAEKTMQILEGFRTGVTKPFIEPKERGKKRLTQIKLLRPKRKVDAQAVLAEWSRRYGK